MTCHISRFLKKHMVVCPTCILTDTLSVLVHYRLALLLTLLDNFNPMAPCQLQVNIEIVEDQIMKDSETDGSEMQLGKFVKRVKAKGVKWKREVTDEFAPAGVGSKNDIDILKTVKE